MPLSSPMMTLEQRLRGERTHPLRWDFLSNFLTVDGQNAFHPTPNLSPFRHKLCHLMKTVKFHGSRAEGKFSAFSVRRKTLVWKILAHIQRQASGASRQGAPGGSMEKFRHCRIIISLKRLAVSVTSSPRTHTDGRPAFPSPKHLGRIKTWWNWIFWNILRAVLWRGGAYKWFRVFVIFLRTPTKVGQSFSIWCNEKCSVKKWRRSWTIKHDKSWWKFRVFFRSIVEKVFASRRHLFFSPLSHHIDRRCCTRWSTQWDTLALFFRFPPRWSHEKRRRCFVEEKPCALFEWRENFIL